MREKHSPIAGIFSFAGQKRGAMAGSALLAALSVFMGIVPYFAASRLLIEIFDSTGAPQSSLLWAGVASAGFILKIVFFGQATLLSHQAAYEILKNIRSAITMKLSKAPMGYLQSHPSGEFKQSIVDVVDKLEYPLAHFLPELTSNLLAPIAILVYLFTIDWRMALAALAAIPVGFLIYALMMVGRGTMYEKFTSANAHMNSTVVEYVNGIEVIKAFNQTASSMQRYEDSVTGFRDLTMKWYRHCWPFLSAFSVIMPSSIAVVLPLGALFYANGTLVLGELIACLILSLGFTAPVMKLVEFSENLVTIIDTEKTIHELLAAEELPQAKTPVELKNHDIVFDRVYFTYDQEPVMNDISFLAKEGTVTALVGPSGSGKSTVARLLARFWDVSDGEIRVGGKDIRRIPLDGLMDTVSYVSQENYLFDLSIRENIRIGKPSATDKEIETVAEQAGCSDFVERFSNGLDTQVGDAGDRLSGGERQRIAIARAMIKDSPIIILDEATASVDPENENLIQNAIHKLVKDKTLVVIAHRLSTVRDADQILVLDEGRLAQRGTHGELLETPGIYQNFWKIRQYARNWKIS
jgi:ATP-binding cassette subfamily B protein